MENYNGIDPVILKKSKKFYKIINQLIYKAIGEREFSMTAKDIYMITLRKIAKGKRKFKNKFKIETEFIAMLRSVAYNLIRKELRQKSLGKIAAQEIEFQNLPDIIDERVCRAIADFWEWLINNNQVELYFIVIKLMEKKTELAIADELQIKVRRVKYLKVKLQEILNEFLNGKNIT